MQQRNTTDGLSHFNSQPHKEADFMRKFNHKEAVISTHSLTRRLTAVSAQEVAANGFQLTASQGG